MEESDVEEKNILYGVEEEEAKIVARKMFNFLIFFFRWTFMLMNSSSCAFNSCFHDDFYDGGGH